jgi:hypothetical protein
VKESGRDIILMYYHRICLEVLRNITKALSQDSWSPCWDFKPEPPRYEAAMLPTGPRRLVLAGQLCFHFTIESWTLNLENWIVKRLLVFAAHHFRFSYRKTEGNYCWITFRRQHTSFRDKLRNRNKITVMRQTLHRDEGLASWPFLCLPKTWEFCVLYRKLFLY